MQAPFCTIKTVCCSILIGLLMLCPTGAVAQNNFNGILVNLLDSSFVPHASIQLKETGAGVITNEKGEFSFKVPDEHRQVTLTIAAIGCKRTIVYNRVFTDRERVYVELVPGSLNEVTVVGMSAPDVMKKVLAGINGNYMDESHYAISFYRQYQNVNGIFMNLMEAMPIVWFKIAKKNNAVSVAEQFSVDDVRHSRFRVNPGSLYDNYLHRLILENPVYHLAGSSLDTNMQGAFTFTYDSTQNGADYVINYTSPDFSSEHHGVEKYAIRGFEGESWETGKLVIDKKTFAIKKYTRSSARYDSYNYPGHNNLLQPTRDYYVEYIDGEMEADYVQFEGKWYLKKLAHRYTNQYLKPYSIDISFTITDVFEWQSLAVLPKLDSFEGKFTNKMPDTKLEYDPVRWKDVNYPFWYFDKEAVYKDLERMGPMDEQFHEESLIK